MQSISIETNQGQQICLKSIEVQNTVQHFNSFFHEYFNVSPKMQSKDNKLKQKAQNSYIMYDNDDFKMRNKDEYISRQVVFNSPKEFLLLYLSIIKLVFIVINC